MTTWIQKPVNQIVIDGDPLRLEVTIGANATAAKMLPGRFVIHDADDGDVKEDAAGKALNVLGQLDVAPDKLESDAYAVGDRAILLTGVYAGKVLLLANENVAPGDRLVTAAAEPLHDLEARARPGSERFEDPPVIDALAGVGGLGGLLGGVGVVLPVEGGVVRLPAVLANVHHFASSSAIRLFARRTSRLRVCTRVSHSPLASL